MDTPYKAPAYGETAFNCPHSSCRAYAKQTWWNVKANFRSTWRDPSPEIAVSLCEHCGQDSHWLDGKLVFPASRSAPPPNPDLSDDIRRVYDEAAAIEGDSAKGAAALLRLCVQRLCQDLGEKGKNINDDIGELVKKGLPVEIQQALDVVRVVGNNAVHPGAIDLDDRPETVSALFTLINAIADRMITQPKKVAALYGTLPPGIVDAIQKRDKPKE